MGAKMVAFFPYSKDIQNSLTFQGCIFCIQQHFATKLDNSTNFKVLFQAVVVT